MCREHFGYPLVLLADRHYRFFALLLLLVCLFLSLLFFLLTDSFAQAPVWFACKQERFLLLHPGCFYFEALCCLLVCFCCRHCCACRLLFAAARMNFYFMYSFLALFCFLFFLLYVQIVFALFYLLVCFCCYCCLRRLQAPVWFAYKQERFLLLRPSCFCSFVLLACLLLLPSLLFLQAPVCCSQDEFLLHASFSCFVLVSLYFRLFLFCSTCLLV